MKFSAALWAIVAYLVLLGTGLVNSFVVLLWPGPTLLFLQIWSPVGVWAVNVGAGVAIVLAGFAFDRWRSPALTVARAIGRGVLVTATALTVLSFVLWNIAMTLGIQIGV